MEYSNKNFIGEDGLIHQEYYGYQTAETVKEDMRRMGDLIEKLHAQSKSANMLLDLSGITGQDSGTRAEAFKAVKSLNYDKMALYGMNPFLKYVAKFVISTTGMGSKIGLFGSKEEATSWLKQ